jgi:hypothetical protein
MSKSITRRLVLPPDYVLFEARGKTVVQAMSAWAYKLLGDLINDDGLWIIDRLDGTAADRFDRLDAEGLRWQLV